MSGGGSDDIAVFMLKKWCIVLLIHYCLAVSNWRHGSPALSYFHMGDTFPHWEFITFVFIFVPWRIGPGVGV